MRIPSAAPVLLLTLLVSACTGPAPRPAPTPEPVDGPPAGSVDPDSVPQPTPRQEPRSRYGNPPSYQVFGKSYRVLDSAAGYEEEGIASWYGRKFQGRRTSSGEPYDMLRYTAAHRTLPLPTFAQVTNLENGRKVIVRVNDRGPFKDGRIIDLSYIAARKLGYADKGTARVRVRAIDPESAPSSTSARDTGAASAIFLQAGSFAEEENAMSLRQKLADAGLAPVNVLPVRVEGETYFRVRIGPIGGAEEANELGRRVTELGLEPPRLIVD